MARLPRLHPFLYGVVLTVRPGSAWESPRKRLTTSHVNRVLSGRRHPADSHNHHHYHHHYHHHKMTLEVEQKFQLRQAADLEPTLESLGFRPVGTVVFVDWYFDVDDNYLSRNDYWLRYREKSGRGQWELKIGRGHSGTTVYEEIEGDQACIYALSCLKEGGYNTTHESGPQPKTFDEFDIPPFPESVSGAFSYDLRPFCRLETRRSSWKVNRVENPYYGLSVDLDSTNTGHTVGEVEMMCHEAEVEAGKARVQDLIVQLCGRNDTDSDAAIGKLEHFLLNNRPWHYEMCVQSGVLQKVPRANP